MSKSSLLQAIALWLLFFFASYSLYLLNVEPAYPYTLCDKSQGKLPLPCVGLAAVPLLSQTERSFIRTASGNCLAHCDQFCVVTGARPIFCTDCLRSLQPCFAQRRDMPLQQRRIFDRLSLFVNF